MCILNDGLVVCYLIWGWLRWVEAWPRPLLNITNTPMSIPRRISHTLSSVPSQITHNHVYIAAIVLRVCFFLFGLYQDAYLPVKYTDIDYLVFSDAAHYVYDGLSPYKRETYRYTPLLSWMMLPNAFGGLFVHFGKLLFMLCDLLTGVLIARNLGRFNSIKGIQSQRNTVLLSAIWLLNPMVITISTRGSSESVLSFIIMLSVDLLLTERYIESAWWLGLAIHFKIYPVIYLPSVMYYLAPRKSPFVNMKLTNLVNSLNLKYLVMTLISLAFWNVVMFQVYGYEFLYHSYLYHLTRLDHRHNFSVYNIALYYKSAQGFLPDYNGFWASADIEKFAFVPQLLFSAVLIPLCLAQVNFMSSLFIQTIAFVSFNKVMTSQYFIWFLPFLPHFILTSRISSKPRSALLMAGLWAISQASWLYFAYKLEFLGESTFDTGLLYSSILFFLSNCWIIKRFIELA